MLLPVYLKEIPLDQANQILDRLECLAETGNPYRDNFITMLVDEANYAPAWERSTAENVLVRLYEQADRPADAAQLLRSQFIRLFNRDDSRSPVDTAYLLPIAEDILERIDGYKLQGNPHASLHSYIDRVRRNDATPVKEDDLESPGPDINVLYACSNVKHAPYKEAVQKELIKRYPRVKVDFHIFGWGSGWKAQMPSLSNISAIVVNTEIRTNCGEFLRAQGIPWTSCPGHTGKQSIIAGIIRAASWAAQVQANA
jgi:hypothetical protein